MGKVQNSKENWIQKIVANTYTSKNNIIEDLNEARRENSNLDQVDYIDEHEYQSEQKFILKFVLFWIFLFLVIFSIAC